MLFKKSSYIRRIKLPAETGASYMLSEKEQTLDTIRFWQFIRKNIRTLLVYSVAGAVAGLCITIFIPKEYKSYGIVYPPSSTSIENTIDFPNFGYDVEADRLIQILESREIADSVIQKFDLVTSYEVDKDASDWMETLMKKYYKNVKFERMQSMSVLISVRSKDAQLSANMVNFIISKADELREKIYKKNIVPAYESARLDYESQKHSVDSLQTTLTEKLKDSKISSLLMLMSDAQISIDLDRLNAVGSNSSSATIGPDIIAFKSMYELLKEYKTRFIKVKKTFANPIPKLYIINPGEANFKKISPSYTLNMIVGILFSVVVATAVLLLKNNSETH